MRYPRRKPHMPFRRHIKRYHGRRFIFLRFLQVFGGISLLFLGGILFFGMLAQGHSAMDFRHSRFDGPFFLVPGLFLLGALVLAGMAYRRFGQPFADIMTAVDKVAEGDLSARVKERSRGELGNLERRFNYMVAELERVEQQRRNMTADIAHELRTPLHILQGTLEGILDGVYQPDDETISNSLDETRLLTRLVNDLQTLALAEAGQLPLHPIRFDIRDLLQDVSEAFAVQAVEHSVRLNVELSDESQEILADYDRLYQVLANLVRNSLDHTSAEDEIAISAAVEEEDLIIIIRDTGEGIPPEDLPYVFDRFWRGDKSRSTQGHGLGLAISRGLVQAHSGRINVQSVEGEGTIFRITLPASG